QGITNPKTPDEELREICYDELDESCNEGDIGCTCVFLTPENIFEMMDTFPRLHGPMHQYIYGNLSLQEIKMGQRRVRGRGALPIHFTTEPTIPKSAPSNIRLIEQSFEGFVVAWSAPLVPEGPPDALAY